MVVVKKGNLPSNEWWLGSIVSAFPGGDDRIGVVEIRTSRGTIKHPVHKVILYRSYRLELFPLSRVLSAHSASFAFFIEIQNFLNWLLVLVPTSPWSADELEVFNPTATESDQNCILFGRARGLTN